MFAAVDEQTSMASINGRIPDTVEAGTTVTLSKTERRWMFLTLALPMLLFGLDFVDSLRGQHVDAWKAMILLGAFPATIENISRKHKVSPFSLMRLVLSRIRRFLAVTLAIDVVAVMTLFLALSFTARQAILIGIEGFLFMSTAILAVLIIRQSRFEAAR
jgi:hypothetical protein